MKGHVLDCPELGCLAPMAQFRPPIRGWVPQVHPSCIHLCMPLMFRIDVPGACEEKKPFLLQVPFPEMPRSPTITFVFLHQLQPLRNVGDGTASYRVRYEGGRDGVKLKETPNVKDRPRYRVNPLKITFLQELRMNP